MTLNNKGHLGSVCCSFRICDWSILKSDRVCETLPHTEIKAITEGLPNYYNYSQPNETKKLKLQTKQKSGGERLDAVNTQTVTVTQLMVQAPLRRARVEIYTI